MELGVNIGVEDDVQHPGRSFSTTTSWRRFRSFAGLFAARLHLVAK
jgi:hypothetical protein